MQFLADFAEKNKETATGFTAAVKKVLAKIKEFFENLMFGHSSRTLEAGIVRKCGVDVVQGLQEQYDKTFMAALEGNAARNATGEFEQGGERFSIVELDNGMQYVEATENQVIKGNDSTQWAQQVADYINKVIRGGQDFIIKTTQGDYLTITRDTAYKAGFRNQVRNPDGTYRTMTDAEYKVKLNAEIHINELAQVSRKTNKTNVPDYKNHRFAKDGFTYRTAYFKDFDGKYYKLTISVGENGSVSTVYNVGKIKEDTLPSGKIKSTFSGSKANNVSPTNQYITKSPKVNPKPQKNSGNGTTELNSDPEDDVKSDREILAGALMSVAQNEIERNALKVYQGYAKKLDGMNARLREVNAEIRTMMFQKGARDEAYTKRLDELKAEKEKLEKGIAKWDSKLFALEVTKSLQDLLDREKQRTAKLWIDAGRKTMNNYREKQLCRVYTQKIEEKAKNLRKMLLENSEKYHIPDAFKKPVAAFLSLLDFSSERALQGGELTKKDMELQAAFEKVVTLLESLSCTHLCLRTYNNKRDVENLTKSLDKEGMARYNSTVTLAP